MKKQPDNRHRGHIHAVKIQEMEWTYSTEFSHLAVHLLHRYFLPRETLSENMKL